MIKIKTNSNDLIIVGIPEDTTWYKIIDNKFNKLITESLDLPKQFLIYGKDNAQYFNPYDFYLPDGKHKILGKLSELSEEECSRFIKDGSYIKTFWNYITNDNHKSNQFITAKESLISLLQSNGIDTNKELLLIEKL